MKFNKRRKDLLLEVLNEIIAEVRSETALEVRKQIVKDLMIYQNNTERWTKNYVTTTFKEAAHITLSNAITRIENLPIELSIYIKEPTCATKDKCAGEKYGFLCDDCLKLKKI